MLITKFGHSCFLVEEGSARFLVDPGNWSEDISELKNIDALFLSHEHQDHSDPEKIKTLVQNNSEMVIYTNPGVGKILTENNLTWTEFTNGQSILIKNVSIEAVGEQHAEIYPGLFKTPVLNTGFLFGNKLYYPGDSFTVPNKSVEILALPVCAPWSKTVEVIDFAKSVEPKVCFPVHDGMLKHSGPFYRIPQMFLESAGIQMLVPEIGQTFVV